MLFPSTFNRRCVQCLGAAGIAAAGYLAGLTADRVTAQPPQAPLPSADKRIVAYIYKTLPVTREELGDFLIARGGYDKLDLLVNKRIIEVEAARRNITVTPLEVQSTLEADVKGLGITIKDFTDKVLPRYNKSLYEWTEDVIKPRLLLGKMCKDRVVVTEEDLKKAYENKYGEKRQPRIICWNKGDLRIAEKQWDEARKSDADFERVARTQATASLAASSGLIAPIGRYPDAEDETCTRKLYELRDVGEMTGIFETPAGYMCMKLVSIVPGDPTVYKITDQSLATLKTANLSDELMMKIAPLKNKEFSRGDLIAELIRVIPAAELNRVQDLVLKCSGDAVTSFAKLRDQLMREVYEKKQAAEIPKFFNELKVRAEPNLLLKGPPSSMDIREAAKQEVQELQQSGGAQPAPQRKP
jgi:hypothetical protein